MFYREEAVRSNHYGMGIVTQTGEDPTVHFLDGPMCTVSGNTLAVIPCCLLYNEIEKRRLWDRFFLGSAQCGY